MRNLMSQYGRFLIYCLVTLVCLSLLNLFLFNVNTENALGLNNEQEINGSYEEFTMSNYVFDINTENSDIKGTNVLTKCIGEKINYSDYIVAYLTDTGEDIKSYVVTDGLESTQVPGTYTITYYLNFEGEKENRELTVTLEDKSINLSCPVFDEETFDEKSCTFDSDCPSNYVCEAKKLYDSEGNEIAPTDEDKKELNKNKVCVVKTRICASDDDCKDGEVCLASETEEGKNYCGVDTSTTDQEGD